MRNVFFVCAWLLLGMQVAFGQDDASSAEPIAIPSVKPPECLSHYDPKVKYGPPKTGGPTGSAIGTITWQFNEYVGTRGDNGAEVLLFPSDRLIDAADVGVLADPDISPSNCNYKYHLHEAEADGNGVVTFDDLPVGTYSGVIYSKQAKRHSKDPLDPNVVELFKYLVNGPITAEQLTAFPSDLLLVKAMPIFNLKIRPSGITHFSQDFGYSAY